MQAFEVLQAIIDNDDLSVWQVSKRAGKPRTFVSKTIARRSNPNCTTMAELLGAMGYELVARGKTSGKEYRITPPSDFIG